MDRIEVTIDNGEAIARFLRTLPNKVVRRHLRRAIAKGGKVFVDHAAKEAPVAAEPIVLSDGTVIQPGALAASIRMQTSVRRKTAAAIVGPSLAGWYGFFTEVGTKNIAPQHWLRSAFYAGADEAFNSAAGYLRGLIESERA